MIVGRKIYSKLEELRKRIYLYVKDRKRLALTLLGLLLLLMLMLSNQYLKSIFFIVILLAANLVISFVLRPLGRFYIGFELILLSTVLVSVAFGPKAGMIMGLLSAIVNYIANMRFSIYCLVEVPLYMLIGLGAYFFQSMGIVMVGLIAVIAYNLLLNIAVLLFMPTTLTVSFIWSITNIGVNYILFNLFAPTMLRLMM